MITRRLRWPGMVSEYSVTPRDSGICVTRPYQLGVGFSGHARLAWETAGRGYRHDVDAGAVYVTGEQPITWLEVRDPTEALEIYPDWDLVERMAGGPVEVQPALAVRGHFRRLFRRQFGVGPGALRSR